MENVKNSRIHETDNPIGLICIDHLEFTYDQHNPITKKLFYKLGFSKSFECKDLNAELFSQGQVRFLLIDHPDSNSHAKKYFNAHEEGVSKISFQVENIEHAVNEAVKRGAELVQNIEIQENQHGVFKTAAIQGFGDVLNEFVEKNSSYFRADYEKIEDDPDAQPLKARVARIDHLTNNVPKGEMRKWVDFYKTIYGFEVTRYFDIKGQKTGLQSEVVQLKDGSIIIPINEPSEDNSKSQIQEFLDRHKGAGVQHIALTCGDILTSVGDLRQRGIKFLDIPHTYYEDIPNRPFTVTESIEELEQKQLLVDGDAEGYLIQNFTETYIGPLFFEFIKRKKHNGFGEGNFQALFDAIERDQVERGYLK